MGRNDDMARDPGSPEFQPRRPLGPPPEDSDAPLTDSEARLFGDIAKGEEARRQGQSTPTAVFNPPLIDDNARPLPPEEDFGLPPRE